MAVGKIAQAFTRGIFGLTDAGVIERAKPQAMEGETATADLAGNLMERVESRLIIHTDGENTDPIDSG